jgi:hypothetical protein
MQLILERIIAEETGLYGLNDEKAVATHVTHELLLLASDVVAAEAPPRTSKRTQLKLLAKLVAAAVGGHPEDTGDQHLTAGKRLDRQVERLRESFSQISRTHLAAYSRLQHEAHADPTTLAAALPAIEAVHADFTRANEMLLTEIYNGFTELGKDPDSGSTPETVSDAQATITRSQIDPDPSTVGGRKGSWQFMEDMPEWDEGYAAGEQNTRISLGITHAIEKHAMGVEHARACSLIRLQLDHQVEENKRLVKQQEEHDSRVQTLAQKCDRRQDAIDMLKRQLGESRAREDALHRVIRDMYMSSEMCVRCLEAD